LKLESIRNDTFTMKDILRADQEVLDWWESIDVR